MALRAAVLVRPFLFLRGNTTWIEEQEAFHGGKVQLPDDAVTVEPERTYTSPIWYTPWGCTAVAGWSGTTEEDQ
jgi:hypothetical protein